MESTSKRSSRLVVYGSPCLWCKGSYSRLVYRSSRPVLYGSPCLWRKEQWGHHAGGVRSIGVTMLVV